jgi:hypothetical protein
MRDYTKIITYPDSFLRWYFLMFLWGLIFSGASTFVGELIAPAGYPEHLWLAVLSVLVIKPCIFILAARAVARRKWKIK